MRLAYSREEGRGKCAGLKGLCSVKYLFARGLARAEYLPLLCDEALLVAPFLAPETHHLLHIYMYVRGEGRRKVAEHGCSFYSFYSSNYQKMKTLPKPSPAGTLGVPSLTFRAYTIKELGCLYFPQKTAIGASRSLRALISHDPVLLSELRAQGYRPRAHYLPPAAVQVLLEHLGTPMEFYEILRQS